MVQWVDMWMTALDEVVQEARAHDDDAFIAYLRWFLPRTRTQVTYVLREPPMEIASVTQTYLRSRDVNFDYVYDVIAEVATELTYGIDHYDDMTAHQHHMLYRRARDACSRFMRAVSCCGGHGDVVFPPRASYPRSSSPAPTQQVGTSSQPPVRPPPAGTSYAAPAPPPSWYVTPGPSTVLQTVDGFRRTPSTRDRGPVPTLGLMTFSKSSLT
ncbi:uncharacterized protein LOC111256597 [Setaria italica]|uniref:uncharacterized protein LOC111256597 n=1 Tax=Setaria italica TaxID=4555 RepID=UPI000BE5B2BC|nr:uncharacterized protein LOC111256597 [Setaria italica]